MLRTLRLISFLLAGFVATWSATFFSHAAEPARRNFDLPAGEAETTLRLFATQAGGQFVFSSEKVAGVRTKPVKGSFTKHEALTRMLEGTGLRAVVDAKTGALTVDRVEESADEAKEKQRESRAQNFFDTRNGNERTCGLGE